MTVGGDKVRVGAALALAQLRDRPLRTAFAIVGIALAVLSVTVLAGVGVGVVDTGQQQFETADRDLWVTAGETRITPARGGGFENTLMDSRTTAAEIESREDVRTAVPMAFDTVYIDTGDGEFEPIIATGVPGTGSAVSLDDGRGFSATDRHYADGSYDGEMIHEVIIDHRTRDRFDLQRNDTARIGASLSIARDNEFTVVGTSETIADLLGESTVTLPLDEFHRITGTTETEPATFIVITLEDGSDPETVAAELQDDHPELAVRTNAEQLEAVLQEQVLVLAAGGTFIALAIITGIALTAQLLTLLAYQQRKTFAALVAQGCSRGLIVSMVGWQGVILGTIGGLVGVGLTPIAVRLLNEVAYVAVGFDGLVTTEPWILFLGGAIAVVIGTGSALLAGVRVLRGDPLVLLR